MVLCSEVPNGVVPQVGRSKYHVVGSAGVTQDILGENEQKKLLEMLFAICEAAINTLLTNLEVTSCFNR